MMHGMDSPGNGGPGDQDNPADNCEPLALDQIQGNIIGFNTPRQYFYFLNFDKAAPGALQTWLRGLHTRVTTASDVLKFRAERGPTSGEDRPAAPVWCNVAFSFAGLRQFDTLSVVGFPGEFITGMAARHWTLGDSGESAPRNWLFGAARPAVADEGDEDDARYWPIHALLIIAGDDRTSADVRALNKGRASHERALERAGIRVAYQEQGRDIENKRGFEHFGFRDGVSQPGFRGETFNKPNHDPTWSGEFVLGYPRQHPAPSPSNPKAYHPPDELHPDWTRNGSFLVCRRLRQDVEGFNRFMEMKAAALGVTSEWLRAMLIGRYRSGVPLAARTELGELGIDPGAEDSAGSPEAALLEPERINAFNYGDDKQSALVPFGAHIRRLNPRVLAGFSEAFLKTRRILRRAIPFTSERGDEKGLIFISYQRSIAGQFEFLQQSWANDRTFPRVAGNDPPGRDPLIGRGFGGQDFNLSPIGKRITLRSWITMTGGGYFFSPSIAALRRLSDPLQKGHKAMRDMARVDPEKLDQDSKDFNGGGSCSVLITFTATNLLKDLDAGEVSRLRQRGIYWEVWEGSRCVWRSSSREEEDRLDIDEGGVVTGRAGVTVSKLLEAVMHTYDESMTIKELYDLTLVRSDDVKLLYRNFTVRVYLYGRDRPESDQKYQPIILPIDMCVHGC